MARQFLNLQTGKWQEERPQTERIDSRGSGGQTYTEARPRVMLSAGCHPNQVDEFNEFIRELGLQASLHYEPDGSLRCTSRSALQVFMRERQMIDWDE